jgi:hypothetical protein
MIKAPALPSRLLFLILLAGPLALAADGFDVKTGLWEMTVATATSGVLIPQETLDRMPPEQRERLLAGLKARAAKGPVPHTSKECVTAEDLKRGAFNRVQDQRCVFTPTVQTAKRQAGKMTCPPPGGGGEANFEAVSREQIRGTITITAATGSIKVDMSGKWLGASCAGADHGG